MSAQQYFFVVYRFCTQVIIKFSYQLNRRIDIVIPNILKLIKTAYAASSEDVANAVRIGIHDANESIKRPMLNFLDGIEDMGDPMELAEKTKIYYRNVTMRYLIDAIAEEKVQGGLFGDRIDELHREAEQINEAEMDNKTMTLDSTIAAYFMAALILGLDIGIAIFKPTYLEFFKKTPIGIGFMVATVLMVGYTVMLADSKSRIEE